MVPAEPPDGAGPVTGAAAAGRGADALPVPDHFEPDRVGEVWRVEYAARAAEAEAWRRARGITPSAGDRFRIGLLLVDVQNTFCIPGFELFVGGRSGQGAVDDNRRLCSFVYRNLGRITTIVPTLDTHRAIQVFHPLMLEDENGDPPAPYTMISAEDAASGRWQVNVAAARSLGHAPDDLREYLRHYPTSLEYKSRYALTVWPYHAMLGGVGHALVSAVDEAVFFHTVARVSQPEHQLKGDDPWTENYSALGPEVDRDASGAPLGRRNRALLKRLASFDALVVAGQAKSHCVAWTVADLLAHFQATDPEAARRVYLLDDCSSPVVVPGVIDYTEESERAFDRFEDLGAHRVVSTTPMSRWPGVVGSQGT